MKLADVIKDPARVIFAYGIRGGFRFLSDEKYAKLLYRCFFKHKLNLESPQTFNEKIHWLKLHNRKEIYTTMVDKYEAKNYVKEIIGGEYIIPTLGVWDKFEEIDFAALPDQFVLKTTHDSGGVVVCKDKNSLDIGVARKKIEASLKRNYYWAGRESAYKDVKPRIIAEKYLPLSGEKCAEYKLFYNYGKLKYVLVCTGEAHSVGKRTNDFFDAEFNHLPVKSVNLNATVVPQKPHEFEELLELAEKLAKDHPLLRVDFYLVEGAIYFGELTFFHDSGFVRFQPEEWDRKFGESIELRM